MAREGKKRMKGFGTWLFTKFVWAMVLLSGTLTVCAAFFVRFSHGAVPMQYVYVMLCVTVGLSVLWRILSFMERRAAKRLLNDKAAALVLAARMAAKENGTKEGADADADAEAAPETDPDES
ncbi:MAG: hypothetical protein K6F52_02295 [Clostridia bacterium]|nr:hypothetical protein [Clostridia bacterium]